jgi:hypothetical protein
MLADEPLCDELRRRLNIIRKSTFPCPYEIGGMHSGEMWLSPDEGFSADDLAKMTYDDVLRIHSEATAAAVEARKEAAAQAVAKPRTKKKTARKTNTKRKGLDLDLEADGAEADASPETEAEEPEQEGLVLDTEESTGE